MWLMACKSMKCRSLLINIATAYYLHLFFGLEYLGALALLLACTMAREFPKVILG